MKTTPVVTLVVTLLALGAAVAEAGESRKPSKGPPPFSGFLRDYGELEPIKEAGRKNLLYYRKPGISLRDYHSIVIEPIEVWFDPGAGVVGIQPDALKEITDYFIGALERGTLHDVAVVNDAGPGVLRLRVALTELVPVKKRRGFMAYSGLTGFIVSSAKRGAMGAHVAQVSVEGELLDSATGERLCAMVERRLGKKKFKKDEKVTTDHVRKVIDFWVDRFHERIAELGTPGGDS